MWSVAEAKAKLSNLLQRARDGEPQIVGEKAPCVILSLEEFKRLKALEESPHLGKWLVETFRGLGEIELPSRKDHRPIPFSDWLDEERGG